MSLVIIYKLSASFVQLIGNSRMAECINEVGSALTYIFAITTITAVLFFITITIITGSGNSAAAIR